MARTRLPRLVSLIHLSFLQSLINIIIERLVQRYVNTFIALKSGYDLRPLRTFKAEIHFV